MDKEQTDVDFVRMAIAKIGEEIDVLVTRRNKLLEFIGEALSQPTVPAPAPVSEEGQDKQVPGPVPPGSNIELSARDKILAFAKHSHKQVSANAILAGTQLPKSTVSFHLRSCLQKDLLKKYGSSRASRYEITDRGSRALSQSLSAQVEK